MVQVVKNWNAKFLQTSMITFNNVWMHKNATRFARKTDSIGDIIRERRLPMESWWFKLTNLVDKRLTELLPMLFAYLALS